MTERSFPSLSRTTISRGRSQAAVSDRIPTVLPQTYPLFLQTRSEGWSRLIELLPEDFTVTSRPSHDRSVTSSASSRERRARNPGEKPKRSFFAAMPMMQSPFGVSWLSVVISNVVG